MKILVTGKNGQLGWELSRALLTCGEVIAVDRQQMDLENPDAITTLIREIRPGLIVNAAAYTAVDQAEQDEQHAWVINAIAPGIMAEEAKRIGAGIVHYSTNYVFDGKSDSRYTEKAEPTPLNLYGKSKLAGEQALQAAGALHLVLRTSWLYGNRGKNFLRTILRLARERDEIRIVNDQTGAPTWSRLIGQATAHIIATGRPLPLKDGLYHLTATGETSWFGFAQAILEITKMNDAGPLHQTRLLPIPSSAYPTPARRPTNSRLCCDRLMRDFNLVLPDWRTSLHLCAADTPC